MDNRDPPDARRTGLGLAVRLRNALRFTGPLRRAADREGAAGASLAGAAAHGFGAAIDVIRSEHRSLGKVIHALQQSATELRDSSREPDFALLCAMLYYIDVFPDRMHHPKEELYLFKALRLRTAAANRLLAELQEEHRRGVQLLRQVDQALVHYQGGAADGAEFFAATVEAHADLQWNHVRKEEQKLLPLAVQYLTEGDCQLMGEVFLANDDPMFGERPSREFERLFAHIAARLDEDPHWNAAL